MPRYVILEHDHPHLHWDLMLEVGEVLETWRLARPPQGVQGETEVMALPNHRRGYLDYEGPVSRDRGTVKQWDVGNYEEDAVACADGRCYCLHGTRFHGRVQLIRTAAESWRMHWNSE